MVARVTDSERIQERLDYARTNAGVYGDHCISYVMELATATTENRRRYCAAGAEDSARRAGTQALEAQLWMRLKYWGQTK